MNKAWQGKNKFYMQHTFISLFLFLFALNALSNQCELVFDANKNELVDSITGTRYQLQKGNFKYHKETNITKQCFGTCFIEAPYLALEKQISELTKGKFEISRVHFVLSAWRRLYLNRLNTGYDIFRFDEIQTGKKLSKKEGALEFKNLSPFLQKKALLDKKYLDRLYQILEGGLVTDFLIPERKTAMMKKLGLRSKYQVHVQLVGKKSFEDKAWEQRKLDRFTTNVREAMQLIMNKHHHNLTKRLEPLVSEYYREIKNIAKVNFIAKNKRTPADTEFVLKLLEQDGLSVLAKVKAIYDYLESLKNGNPQYPDSVISAAKESYRSLKAILESNKQRYVDYASKYLEKTMDGIEEKTNAYWSEKLSITPSDFVKTREKYLITNFQKLAVKGREPSDLAKVIQESLDRGESVVLDYYHLESPLRSFEVVENVHHQYKAPRNLENILTSHSDYYNAHGATVRSVVVNKENKEVEYIELTGTMGWEYGFEGKYLIAVKDLPRLLNHIYVVKTEDKR